ncbi:transient-receptor-potential-like protein, partial [Aplysia californica]|uniref:Transient-receptor-potential-like protein n=1 Tax=Aplysia californica TaxID=6500 RepID=A0ABM1VWT5_APLCA
MASCKSTLYGMGWTIASMLRAKVKGQPVAQFLGHRMDPQERIFLDAVEKGDKPTVIRCLTGSDPVSVNCTDMLGRSAIQIAVDNENIELVELLLRQEGVKIGDALLYAIREGVYRIVEMLIEHPSISRDMLGADWSKNRLVGDESFDYSPDISPVILAAHCNQFEILQLLLVHGATIDRPHQLSCSCKRCQAKVHADSLTSCVVKVIERMHAERIYYLSEKNEWIADIQAGFHQGHSCTDQTIRICQEIEDSFQQKPTFHRSVLVLLDYSKAYDTIEGKKIPFNPTPRLLGVYLDRQLTFNKHIEEVSKSATSKMKVIDAVSYSKWGWDKESLKKFVAHPHCQQLLTSVWYEGLPGWRKRNGIMKFLTCIGLILILPFMSLYYLIFPRSKIGQLLRSPFMKFLYHRCFVWAECKQLWDEGLKAYIRQWWNWLDFLMLSLYLATFSLRVVAYFQVCEIESGKYGQREMKRKDWPQNDPTLISEGLFAIANVFSFARIIYLFQYCASDTEVEHSIILLFKSYVTLFWSMFSLTTPSKLEIEATQSFTMTVGELLFMAYHAMAIIVLLNMLIAMMSSSFQEIENHADMEWKFARSKLWMGYFDEGSTLPSPFNLIISPKSVYYLAMWMKKLVFCCVCRRRPDYATRRRKSSEGTIRPRKAIRPSELNIFKTKGSAEIHVNNEPERPTFNGRVNSTRLTTVPPAQSEAQQYQDVMRRLICRYIHQTKKQSRQDGVNEDDLLEIK